MGVAIYLVLDNDQPGFDVDIDGKALAKAGTKLAKLCKTLGMPAIDHFVSVSDAELTDILDEADLPELATQWFPAAEGLHYFRKIAEHLRANPDVLPRATDVIADIEQILRVLEQAQQIAANWRLSLDI
jgi:hypothetical protein